MSNRVIRRYFAVDNPEAVHEGRAILERVRVFRVAAEALAAEFGFERAALRNDVLGLSLAGFSLPSGDPDRLWRKIGKTSEGNDVYVPRRSLKQGKAASARMAELKRVPLHRSMLAAVGLEDFSEVWGAVGAGWGFHYASATPVEGDNPCMVVSLPLAKTDSPLPPSLDGARELTEHQYETMIESSREPAHAEP